MTLIEMLRANGSWEADAAVTAIQVRDMRIEKLEAALKKIALDEPDCCMIADRMRETAEIALGLKDD